MIFPHFLRWRGLKQIHAQPVDLLHWNNTHMTDEIADANHLLLVLHLFERSNCIIWASSVMSLPFCNETKSSKWDNKILKRTREFRNDQSLVQTKGVLNVYLQCGTNHTAWSAPSPTSYSNTLKLIPQVTSE